MLRVSIGSVDPDRYLRSDFKEAHVKRLGASIVIVLAILLLFSGCEKKPEGPVAVEFWHAMTGKNAAMVQTIADNFNKSQADYIITPVFKGTYSDTMNAGIAAYRAGQAPGIIQVYEVGTATMMSAKGAIVPVGKIMADAGYKFDPKLYGFQWAPEAAPRFQLEPLGYRGYIEARPVTEA